MRYQVAKQYIFESKVGQLLVTKIFHDAAIRNFVEKLKLIKKIEPQPNIFSENKSIGRALYLYKSGSATNVHVLTRDNLDWPFPDKYSKKIGLSVRGFEFVFPNLENSIKNLLNRHKI